MKKVWLLRAQENWICDRLVDEWETSNADMTTDDINQADIIWLLSDWRWRSVNWNHLLSRRNNVKVLTTVHHIVPEKFDDAAKQDFELRDQITSAYHVYNVRTMAFIRPLTQKPIYYVPYWANQNIWYPTSDKVSLRTKYGLPQDTYIIGSFQRDTEGAGIPNGVYLPKLEKGPDRFVDFVESLHNKHNTKFNATAPITVLLAGWRRQYVINRLNLAGINCIYKELPTQAELNELYQAIDLYVVSARYEGGPQALIECGLTKTPVISTKVGIAEQVLPAEAIKDELIKATPTIPDVSGMILPQGYKQYRNMLQSM